MIEFPFGFPEVLATTDDLLVINKPPACHSVRNPNSVEAAVSDWLEIKYPELADVSERPGEAGLVNRLDFETSGLLLAARSRQSWLNYRKLYSNGKILKKYLCVVQGRFPDSCSCRAVIRTARRAKKVTVKQYNGRELKDRERFVFAAFKLAEYIPSLNRSLLEISTSTGARHQVRALCAFLGHPLFGDELYGGDTNYSGGPAFLLHAVQVEVSPFINFSAARYFAPMPSLWREHLGLSK